MGYRSRWIAVRGHSLEAVLGALEFAETGQTEDWMDTGLWATERQGWVIICGSGWDAMEKVTASQAEALSSGGEALFWTGDDSPMCASVTGYMAGTIRWSMVYEGVNGVSVPEVVGDAPDCVGAHVDFHRALQAKSEPGVDHVYESVHAVGHALTGFRHDEAELPEGAPLFRLLGEPGAAKAKAPTLSACADDGRVSLRLTGSGDDFQIRVKASAPVTIQRLMNLDFADGGIANIYMLAEGEQLAAGEVIEAICMCPMPSTRVQLNYATAAGDFDLTLDLAEAR